MATTKTFEESLREIGRLIEVPSFVKELVLQSLDDIDFTSLDFEGKNRLENCKKSIGNISEQSLSSSFAIIYNQVCILAVSSLSAYLENYFKDCIQARWDKIDFSGIDIKISLGEIGEYGFDISSNIGAIILKKDNTIKFQDLQSTLRSFEKYFGVNITMEENLKKEIIFYQQCRHAIVHQNGIADADFIKKTGTANKKNYIIGDTIQLGSKDWIDIVTAFQKFYTLVVESAKSLY